MEIPDTVSVRKFKEFNVTQKEEVYETLLDLAEAIEDIPKKSLRKTLDLTLAVLEYKGGQASKLQERFEAKTEEESSMDSQNERLLDENEKLQRMLDKLENEKGELKNRIKELTDDIFQLQKRLQEAASTAEASDKDSSDPLSELDKQEELLRNINTKNKHIKRLLKEIEALQTQNIEQSKQIIAIKSELHLAQAKELQLSADITEVDKERKSLKQMANELHIEITRLEGNITYLEEEREKSEQDLKDFIDKLELKAQSWKSLLEQKDRELKQLRNRLEREGGLPMTAIEAAKTAPYKPEDDEQPMSESTKMMHAIESRDQLIEQLELKIKTMAEEMLSSTRLMNKLSADREEERSTHKTRDCCKITEEALQAANTRCQELSELLEHAEEDNALKSKQAMQAVAALNAYQSGEDGLVKALRKCTSLEQKLMSRDKQIRALIMELNSMHEIVHENNVLRKRLNIPADVVITAKNLAAKERQKDKIIERLTLKLRASEEMRLQLKLEKSDLRKEIMELQTRAEKPVEPQVIVDSSSGPSEFGEVEESLPVVSVNETAHIERNICQTCREKFDLQLSDDSIKQDALEAQVKYQEAFEENEVLRIGMHEILEKLREYDDCSDHITIDTGILYRLLQTLQKRSPGHSPKHLQMEVLTLKQRERALRELLQQEVQPHDTETDELESVGEIRNGSEMRRYSDDSVVQLPSFVDSATRPTTPNRNADEHVRPIILDAMDSASAEVNKSQRDLKEELAELEIYRKHYEELKLHMATSESELACRCVDLVEQVRSLETELNTKNSRYDFMMAEFDVALTQTKHNEMQHVQQVAELKKQLQAQQQQVKEFQRLQDEQMKKINYTAEEYEMLLQDRAALQAQMAHIITQLLNGELKPELKIEEICTDYGIINENMQLDYITLAEFEQQKSDLKAATENLEEMHKQRIQLEGLLEIAQEQIQTQQKLLNEITDNHINLRHLVADLQSSSDDRFVLAKMQRDLDSAKLELGNLKTERDILKQRETDLQTDLNKEKLLTANLHNDFQKDMHNRNLKIKFLQKALYTLKEKYAKFTPLIFLTNFIFAYNKFIKKTQTTPATVTGDEHTPEQVADIVRGQLEAHNCGADQAETLVKLIKTETQLRLSEENLILWQKKCERLQEELEEQRIRDANESEHWQTIEALFGDANKERTSGGQSELRNVGTNTEKIPVAIPRRMSSVNNVKPESVIAMVDVQTSPIGSPTKKELNAEQSTQTESAVEGGNMEIPSALESPKVAEVVMASETLKTEKSTSNAAVQTIIEERANQGVQTIEVSEANAKAAGVEVQAEAVQEPTAQSDKEVECIKEQLSEARSNANAREKALQQCQQELSTAKTQIETLQKQLEEQKLTAKKPDEDTQAKTKDNSASHELTQQSGIIEKTILSFHTLLTEKDKSISKYQDLLQSEREQGQSAISKIHAEMLELKTTINNLNFNIKTKDMEILELKTKLETSSVRRNSNEKLDLATASGVVGEDNGDNSLNELTDEKIEEMFQQEPGSESLPKDGIKELQNMQKQLEEFKGKIGFYTESLKVKEEELTLLKEKVSLYEEREKTVEHNANNAEIEQLRLLLEDKDKHINELMETLNNFHDDQQRLMTDSTQDTSERITQLSSDLTRTEATNKIYQTQVEALRRQLASMTQREKQARELSQSLRNQLIKRPVVSIKTELNARVKQEKMQKRIQQLELELDEARAQLQKQQLVIDAKRARSANEVVLWEKQKRWQQNAEKFKAKLEETEIMLEKTRSLLQTARNTIGRLEKDKHALELRMGRGGQQTNIDVQQIKCCRMPSCVNLQQGNTRAGKYTPSESPETYTGGSSECSSPAHSASAVCGGRMQAHSAPCYGATTTTAHAHPHTELIEALKARLELQQSKIIAMELEGKGTNALTTELEKLQERFSALEAQNIRLEARNLQLQLDNDLLRQGDGSERLQKRIKHLEDYIIALKEERAQIEARQELCKCSGIRVHTQQGQSAEQTILSLRNIVEKLRAENKYLKDGRRPSDSKNSSSNPNSEVNRLQQLYADSLDKINSLQMELNVKAKSFAHAKGDSHLHEELGYVKEQLLKKTQLLQKAKVLLTRAAAKEKVLKEQLMLWKRKCSELQNVPVIDEISE